MSTLYTLLYVRKSGFCSDKFIFQISAKTHKPTDSFAKKKKKYE